MSKKIRLVQGDTRPQLVFSVTDDNTDLPIDLSDPGTSAVVKFRETGSDTIKATMDCFKLTGIVLEDDTVSYDAPYNGLGTGGRLYMDWSADALDTDGSFEAELEITFSDGGVLTAYETAKFVIREQF